MATNIEGVIVVEGEATGDGRIIAPGALTWDDALPLPILFDPDDGDHTGVVVGYVDRVERREGGQIFAAGALSESEDPEVARLVGRVVELLDEQAVGVSVSLDHVSAEIRVSVDAIEREEAGPSENGDGTITVARWDDGEEMNWTTSARLRHVAIVDTPAFAEARISVAASGSIAAAADMAALFADPSFGRPGDDDRLRYDPHSQLWSCPVTVVGRHIFGHVAPWGLCLRGRPESCVTPPDGDLDGFMRHAASAAGGLSTGVVTLGGRHAALGDLAAATSHYDDTGRGVADVRVGRDSYGIWMSGAVRAGVSAEDLETLAGSDVSGHWEQSPRTGRPVLCGVIAVNVGGFPKGFLTWEQVQQGLAASADLDAAGHVGTACSCGTVMTTLEETEPVPDMADFVGLAAAVARIEAAVAPLALEQARRRIPAPAETA